MRVVSIDVETSGLVPTYDLITQIGAVVMEDGVPVSEPFYTHVQPDWGKFKIAVAAAEAQIGGMEGFIEWVQTLKQAPIGLEVAKSFHAWCQTVEADRYPTIAYKAVFDWGFLDSKLFCYTSVFKQSPLSSTWIDVLDLARKHFQKSLPNNTLDAVCVALGIETKRSGHDALQDAILCGQVFHGLGGAYPRGNN